MSCRTCALLALALTACAMASFVHSQSVSGATDISLIHVRLPQGISVDIPSSWTINNSKSNLRRFEKGKRIADLTGSPIGPGGVLLTASPDGHSDGVSVVISVINDRTATQDDVAGLGERRLAQINAQYRADLEAGMQHENATMVKWSGSQRARVGNIYSLVSFYDYSMDGMPLRSMESHRVFLGGGSVGFMLQAPPSELATLAPMFTTIRNSFRASAIP
jgi:hypothetical protein